ncbi:MAG: Fe-S cluster assembly protein SufD [Spirulinaceae cyanobacterium]
MTSQVSSAATVTRDEYLQSLLSLCSGYFLDADLIKVVQKPAATWLSRLRMPNRKDEAWRFTDLSELLATSFVAADKVTPESVEEFVIPEAASSRVTFVNGVYAPDLSNLKGLPEGLFVGNLAQLPAEYQTQLSQYLTQQKGAEEVFTSLNSAGFADVAVVWADANTVVETPLHLLFLSIAGASPSFSQPRILVVAERNSSLQIIEQYATNQDTAYFTNSVAEIYLAENAAVQHIRCQQEATSSFHIGKTGIAQARDSRYTCHSISLGGKLSRHNLEVHQTGEQITTNLNGLTVVNGKQLADLHSLIALTKPHATTDQLQKCLVAGNARSVFDGQVLVPKEAQLTNASQLNRNLLLSPQAHVDTKPQLQITADNVKCSHGATVSQLEAEELFYLSSRGLNEEAARSLLIEAFTAEIIQRIPIKSIQKQLTANIKKAIKGNKQ